MQPCGDEDFHAYIDGMLDPERSFAVANHLAAHPLVAARAAEWRALNEGMRLIFGHILRQPVPDPMRKLIRRHAARSARRRRALAALSAIVTLLLAGLGGHALESHFGSVEAVSAPAPLVPAASPQAIRI